MAFKLDFHDSLCFLGILVAKKKLFRNPVPSNGGGGSVFFVNREKHLYLKETEMREEGGTPAVVESIRAGLVFQLKENISTEEIMKKEEKLCKMTFESWNNIPQLVILGSHVAPRLAIFSFLIRHPTFNLYLHHNFVCAILNDLFGIQARGGCACAGPYALDQLGINADLSQKYENALLEDNRLDRMHLRRYKEYSHNEILRPGFIRLNLPYFMSEKEVNFVLEAVKLVAQEGWKLLPQYIFNPETGEWRHHSHQIFKERKWLGFISYDSGEMKYSQPFEADLNYNILPENTEKCLAEAKTVFEKAEKTPGRISVPDQQIMFDENASILRWFLLPSEVYAVLYMQGDVQKFIPPFTPKVYSACKSLKNPVMTNVSITCLPCKLPRSVQELVPSNSQWQKPPKNLLKPAIEAIMNFDMIKNGDRILICLSGGKDSLSLLHVLHQYQYFAKSNGIEFEIGAVTVDPQSDAYDPSTLKPYLKSLNVPYFYEEQGILPQALTMPELASICSFCSRMKRGRLYSCARRENYNVLAFGQHLDDLAETFFMSVFHNGRLRTMKAKYTVKEGDLRVIRPFVYVREKLTRQFAEKTKLPVIAENCPACFEAPKERHRTKQLLAQQEILFPRLFKSLRASLEPLMAIDRCGLEGETLIRNALKQLTESDP